MRLNIDGDIRNAHKIIIIIIIIVIHGLSRLTCSGIDALPSFPGASTSLEVYSRGRVSEVHINFNKRNLKRQIIP
jgi:hypothetical protein